MYAFVITIIFAVSIVVMLIAYYGKGGPSRKVLFMISIPVFLISGCLSMGFESQAEKVCVSSSLVHSETISLPMIKSTACYVVLDDDEYRYVFTDTTGKEQTGEIDALDCEVTCKDCKPQLTTKTIKKEYRKEWLFLKSNETEEMCTEYEIVVPSKESILDTTQLKRAVAGP